MTPELESYRDQLLAIRQDAPGLVKGLTDAQFNWRPDDGRWSMADCYDHLNATAAVFLPAIDAAIAKAKANNLRSPGPFAYPILDRWFARVMEPPPRLRVKAPAKARPAPGADKSLDGVLTAFMGWQEQIDDRLRQADGLDLARARQRSPIMPLLSYSLGAMFAIVLAHERRHIWQARQVRNLPAFPA